MMTNLGNRGLPGFTAESAVLVSKSIYRTAGIGKGPLPGLVPQNGITCGGAPGPSFNGVCASACMCNMPTMNGWQWQCCDASCCG